MKIISWNCQMAFRKKYKEVLSFQPDLLVIPECENEDKLQFGKLTPKPKDFFWYGDNPHKGIGIFSYADYSFKLSPLFNPAFRYVIPLEVSGLKEFTLIAVWAMPNKQNHKQRYIGQVWSALQFYKELLVNDTIIIGDFNGNQIWDKQSYTGNFSKTLHFLEELNFTSLYHSANKEQYGKETQATFYLYRNVEKPYHLDYCVAHKSIIQNGFNISIGTNDDWIKLSDHTPLIIEIE